MCIIKIVIKIQIEITIFLGMNLLFLGVTSITAFLIANINKNGDTFEKNKQMQIRVKILSKKY
jgi:hypothetical protein